MQSPDGKEPFEIVCAWCKRWRNEVGEWFDRPTAEVPDERVSHGICEDCFADVWPPKQ